MSFLIREGGTGIAILRGMILPCKGCDQRVSDSETNAYHLIAGVLYGWCNECFNKQQHPLKHKRKEQ